MDRETKRLFEEFRRSDAGAIENNLIDELVGGDLDRQEFLRRATMFGLGAGTIGMLLRYIGEDVAFGAPAGVEQVKRGGTLRVGTTAYNRSLEPYGLQESGSLGLAGIPGEYLTFTNAKLQVKPWLAMSWRPNAALTVWTFQLRRGVRFHNGKVMNADDVVASFRQALSQKTSQILSALPASLITPDGVVKTGPYTVQFRLKTPNNAFPYLVSQTTYQAIIQPAAIAAKPDTWVSSGMIGTGAFRVRSQNKQRAELVRFDNYWGGRPLLDGVRVIFYADPAPMVLALRAGQLDLVVQMSPQQARTFRNNSRFRVFTAANSSHNMFGMRVDREPFRDARVRRAVALTLNRPDIINRVLLGAGTLGNDSPFWSGFPSTDPSIKQRKQNLELARALLRAAGQEDLKFTITTHNQADVPDFATAVQAAGRQAGIDINLNVMTYDDYYSAVGGGDYATTTPWLNAPATITEYGFRGVPNLYLTAAYMSNGIWNASKYSNSEFDSVARTYLGSAEIAAQRKATKKMAGFLLRDTPVITAYFLTFVAAGSSRMRNYQADAISHIRVAKTWLA
ncbi:MAG: ABC transporter substrate-binding protein [Actinobacteria bacterium]|nr:ABC transporter substrate-binding protein [Actinomycetota bacterium]